MFAVLLTSFLLLPVVSESVGAAGDGIEKALAAHARLLDTEAKARDMRREAYAEYGAEARNNKEAREALTASRRKAAEMLKAAEDEFLHVFKSSDWNEYDLRTQDRILERGLLLTGQRLFEEHPENSIAAFELLLEKLPESTESSRVRTYYLPAAYLAAGDLRKAEERISGLIEKVEEKQRPGMYLHLGDSLALQAKFDEAKEAYRHAVDVPEDLQPNDPRGRAKRYGELRLALVGQAAPEIESGHWQGREGTTLAALRGEKVVVIDFWATWCGPCRAVMPALNSFYNERKSDGLEIWGLTRYYANGYLPDPSLKPGAGGERVTEIEEGENYFQHLREFRNRMQIDYPFVVGPKSNFDAYKVSGIPTIVVIGKDGRVRFVGVGSGSESMVKQAVAAALAE